MTKRETTVYGGKTREEQRKTLDEIKTAFNEALGALDAPERVVGVLAVVVRVDKAGKVLPGFLGGYVKGTASLAMLARAGGGWLEGVQGEIDKAQKGKGYVQ